MIETVVVVPRWGGRASDDWYPEVRRVAGVPTRLVALAPTAEAPAPRECAAALRRALFGTDPPTTVLVGHSVGCQVLLRHLAAEGPSAGRFAAMIAVAGWWGVDDPWPSLLPWLEPVDGLQRARAAVSSVEVLLSDDDPYTADWRRNRALWRERLDAHVVVEPGAGHFNRPSEPAVAAAVRRWCGRWTAITKTRGSAGESGWS